MGRFGYLLQRNPNLLNMILNEAHYEDALEREDADRRKAESKANQQRMIEMYDKPRELTPKWETLEDRYKRMKIQQNMPGPITGTLKAQMDLGTIKQSDIPYMASEAARASGAPIETIYGMMRQGNASQQQLDTMPSQTINLQENPGVELEREKLKYLRDKDQAERDAQSSANLQRIQAGKEMQFQQLQQQNSMKEREYEEKLKQIEEQNKRYQSEKADKDRYTKAYAKAYEENPSGSEAELKGRALQMMTEQEKQTGTAEAPVQNQPAPAQAYDPSKDPDYKNKVQLMSAFERLYNKNNWDFSEDQKQKILQSSLSDILKVLEANGIDVNDLRFMK